MEMLSTDLLGRLTNLDLPFRAGLTPLYETIVNSLHSIEDLNEKNDKNTIIIKVIRENSQRVNTEASSDRELPHICEFEIIDTGIGFNEDNYKSFQTSDSRFKEKRGGKGIGRLFWLKVFQEVIIESVFEKQNKRYLRKIKFDKNFKQSLDNIPEETGRDRKTSIKLVGFNEDYRKSCLKKSSSIAEKIIEHCLIYFLDPNCPNITILDEIEDVEINLNNKFKEIFSDTKKEVDFHMPDGKKYRLTFLKLTSGDMQSSKLHWCANGRDVFRETLYKSIPNLKGKLKTEDDKSYVFSIYISGDYLNEKVKADRSGFNIPEKDEEDENTDQIASLEKKTTLSEIRDEASKKIKEVLEPELQPIEQEKQHQIKKYVEEDAPQYRALVSLEPNVLENIAPGLNSEKLDLELHKVQYQFEAKLKEEGKQFLSLIKNPSIDPVARSEKEEQYFKKINAVSQSNLAKYVLSRKIIVELFDECIRKKEDGTFDRESVVHNLIFPKYKTSDQIGYEHHNLWLIDEKLSYHLYLASEKKLSKLSTITSASNDRTDIVIFNNPVTFVEGEMPYSAVTVIEFKRPGRDDMENPIRQLLKYTEDIRNGTKRDKDNHELRIPQAVPFFCYLICDLTPVVIDDAKLASLNPTSDNQGYFGFNSNYQAYIEVISYKKVSSDAKKRNRAFFGHVLI